VLLSCVLAAVVGAACSDSEPSSTPVSSTARPSTTTSTTARTSGTAYAGVVEGSNAYVAVVVGPGSEAMAYVCDGASSVDFVEGPVEGGAANLSNDGGAHLEATVTATDASGTFTRPGSDPLRFTAVPVDRPAGLYIAGGHFADGDYVGGWILLPDGTQRASVRRYETPLPPGTPPVLDPSYPFVPVPGGVITPHYVDSADDFDDF
jgi:hypothetical protein